MEKTAEMLLQNLLNANWEDQCVSAYQDTGIVTIWVVRCRYAKPLLLTHGWTDIHCICHVAVSRAGHELDVACIYTYKYVCICTVLITISDKFLFYNI